MHSVEARNPRRILAMQLTRIRERYSAKGCRVSMIRRSTDPAQGYSNVHHVA